jgi:hypothetical protein
MRIFLGKPDDFHTQRNNLIDPANTCNVTSMINALRATGIAMPSGIQGQPEDALARILDTPEAKAKLAKDFPAMASLPPREVHAMLSWAVNEKFIRRKVTTFSVAVTLQEILFRLLKHSSASVVSTTLMRGGHLVTIAGYSTVQSFINVRTPGDIDLDMVRRIYLLDSWGDWTLGYERGSSGFGVPLSVDEFMACAKPVENARKWAHLFSRDGTF